MFYCVNPNHRYQFFSPSRFDDRTDPPAPEPIPTDDQPTEEPERNLTNALAALYKAYGGKEELKNNAVDIIYKIADVIKEKNNIFDGEAGSGGPPSEAGSGEQRT